MPTPSEQGRLTYALKEAWRSTLHFHRSTSICARRASLEGLRTDSDAGVLRVIVCCTSIDRDDQTTQPIAGGLEIIRPVAPTATASTNESPGPVVTRNDRHSPRPEISPPTYHNSLTGPEDIPLPLSPAAPSAWRSVVSDQMPGARSPEIGLPPPSSGNPLASTKQETSPSLSPPPSITSPSSSSNQAAFADFETDPMLGLLGIGDHLVPTNTMVTQSRSAGEAGGSQPDDELSISIDRSSCE